MQKPMQKPNPADLEAERENTETQIHVSADEAASHHQEDRTTEQARQGHTGDHVRYILGFSILGIVVAFIAAYWLFAS
jgi:hypothetical protein